MKRVRLRHPITGGTFTAAESAVAAYAASGWELAEPLDEGRRPPPGEPAIEIKAAMDAAATVQTEASEKKTPRGRRTSKED